MAIAGNDIQISNVAANTNQISFNPVITALTGYGYTTPSITAPLTQTTPITASPSDGNDSLWGGLGGLGGGGRIDAAQAYPGAGLVGAGVGSGIALKTNSQTMVWLLLAGAFAFLLMGNPRHGGRR
jgi:hypothetical protein